MTLLISTAISVFLAIYSWIGLGSAAVAGILVFVGVTQGVRASRRGGWLADKDLRRFARRQRLYGMQVVSLGLLLLLTVLVVSPLLVLAIGAVGSAVLLVEGLWVAARAGPKEAWLFGAMQGLTAGVIAVSLFGYSTMAVALEARDLTMNGGGDSTSSGTGGGSSELTYAELCPDLPDPLKIGHSLGELFRRDGAVRAGCGRKALLVDGWSTWYSPGVCRGKLRSMAISGPEGEPGLVYGEAASFAWVEARQSRLVGVETAGPAGGDVDLISTPTGVYAFVRDHQERVPGNEDPVRCNEIGGEPELFTRLDPPMVSFWAELINSKTEWIWPERDQSGPPGSVAFIGFSSGETIATGRCASDELCQVEIDGEADPISGSSFVKLEKVQTFMPPEE